MTPESDLRSIDDTARFFEVSDKTVRSWIADGCPVVERGSSGVAYKLDLRAVHEWRQARQDAETQAAQERAERDGRLKLELLGDESLAAPAGRGAAVRARPGEAG